MKLSADLWHPHLKLPQALHTGSLESAHSTSPKNKLSIDKDFNLVPVGGGMIAYNKASNHRAGQHAWNIHDLKVSAQLANHAYDNINTPKNIHGKTLVPLTADEIRTDLDEKNGVFIHRPTDGQAMIWTSQDKIYLAFRGTANVHDAKQDIFLPLSARSHDAFNSLVLETAHLAKQEGKPLVITGHSLGANHVNEFATKAAKEDSFALLRDASFIGFASPVFSRHANVLNIGMKNDPVFGVLSTSTHRYVPSFFDQPQYVAGLKYGNDASKHIKNPHAHSMLNIQQSVEQLTRFDRLSTSV